MPGLNVGFNTPFQEQIDFLRQKLRLPTERWDDIMRSAHDRAFIVAGAAKADLLADLHQSLIDAAADGRGLDAWRKDFRKIVKDHGWDGWTGQGTKAGEAWRTRVIYQTNMATSYAAGRYRQLTDPGFLALRPYWRYIHSDSVMHPRPWHLAWHGLTLPADHEFWKTHFPPNGWGCQCRVAAVSKREGEASARAGLGDPPDGWRAVNSKSGEPVGIDKGFGYAPGASVNKPMQEFIDQKLIKLDSRIGAAMLEELNPVLEAERLGKVVAPAPIAVAPEIVQAAPRSVPRLLDAGLPEADYLAAFERSVGGFRTVEIAGAPMRLDDRVFRNAAGELKILKRGRERYVEHLADTILDADDVYEVDEPLRNLPGKTRKVRRLLKTFGEGSGAVRGLAVFVWDDAAGEFTGTTAFVPVNGHGDIDVLYFERQRIGRPLK